MRPTFTAASLLPSLRARATQVVLAQMRILDDRVIGLAYGTAPAPYRVEVTSTLATACSCPYAQAVVGRQCKHAVALACWWLAQPAPVVAQRPPAGPLDRRAWWLDPQVPPPAAARWSWQLGTVDEPLARAAYPTRRAAVARLGLGRAPRTLRVEWASLPTWLPSWVRAARAQVAAALDRVVEAPHHDSSSVVAALPAATASDITWVVPVPYIDHTSR